MYIEVPKEAAQKKRWRFKYRVDGKDYKKSFGTWPDISLREAREERDEARANLKKTGDIAPAKDAKNGLCFNDAAAVWLDKEKVRWSTKHYITTRERFKNHVSPFIGHKPIHSITTSEILQLLQRLFDAGHYVMAKRMRANISRVFSHFMILGNVDKDPAAPLQRALPSKKVRHFSSITQPQQLGQLLCDIDALTGFVSVRYAAKLAPYLFVRPGELRRAEWGEIDFTEAIWRVPGRKMKMKEDHLVPLARQVIDALKELQQLTGHGKYLFPQVRSMAGLCLMARSMWL